MVIKNFCFTFLIWQMPVFLYESKQIVVSTEAIWHNIPQRQFGIIYIIYIYICKAGFGILAWLEIQELNAERWSSEFGSRTASLFTGFWNTTRLKELRGQSTQLELVQLFQMSLEELNWELLLLLLITSSFRCPGNPGWVPLLIHQVS